MHVDQIFDLFKFRGSLLGQCIEPVEIFGKGRLEDGGKQTVFSLEVIKDQRFGGLGLARDLEGCGGLETLVGKQTACGPDNGELLFQGTSKVPLKIRVSCLSES